LCQFEIVELMVAAYPFHVCRPKDDRPISFLEKVFHGNLSDILSVFGSNGLNRLVGRDVGDAPSERRIGHGDDPVLQAILENALVLYKDARLHLIDVRLDGQSFIFCGLGSFGTLVDHLEFPQVVLAKIRHPNRSGPPLCITILEGVPRRQTVSGIHTNVHLILLVVTLSLYSRPVQKDQIEIPDPAFVQGLLKLLVHQFVHIVVGHIFAFWIRRHAMAEVFRTERIARMKNLGGQKDIGSFLSPGRQGVTHNLANVGMGSIDQGGINMHRHRG